MTYDKNIHDKQRRIIEESIAKIPSIKGNGLKYVIVEIAKGNFVGYGGYNTDNAGVRDIRVRRQLRTAVAIAYEARMHHVWRSRTLMQKASWMYDVDMLVKKFGYARPRTCKN